MIKSISCFSFSLFYRPFFWAQGRIATGEVVELFKQYCASCHGEAMEGGLGSFLISLEWKRIGPDLGLDTP